MNTQSPLFKTIAHLLIAVMWAHPLHSIAASLQVDRHGGGSTVLTSAGNGVPVVNIATPNSKGLSHNKFTDYNVGQQGLILNNSPDKLTQTQLGGIIIGNSQLKGKAANTIVNEVTGGQRSQLKGYTEVAGQQAHVIVANPHGITCDGCGFINTPHASLTTGKPMLEKGQLRGYDVDGGDIEIAGAGLNAGNVSRFDLITRSAQINAELYANELNIITGRNQVDADTLNATAKTGQASEQPLLAIDSSALGGMYAGSIRLVGTEAGVGVKLAGDMAASSGDIQIDANGQLTLARVNAAHDLHINTAQDVELTRQAYAGNDITVAATALSNKDNLLARQTIAIDAGQIHSTGVIEAGINTDGRLNTQGRVRVQSAELTNSGSVVASRELNIKTAGKLDNRSGQLVSDGTLTLEAGQLDNRKGLVTAGGDIDVAAAQLDNRGGELIGQQQLIIDSDTLDNRAGVVSTNTRLAVTAGHVDNTGGELSAGQQLTLDAQSLRQAQGQLLSDGTMSLDVAHLDNRDEGLIHAADDLALHSLEHVKNSEDGEISSQNSLHLTVNALDNSHGGVIVSSEQLKVVAQALDNSDQGLLSGYSGLSVLTGDLNNQKQGTLSSREGGLRVQVSGHLDNSQQGALVSQQTLDVQAGSVTNRQGILSSAADVSVQLDGLLDNESGQVFGENIIVTAAQLDNTAGDISADQTLTLTGLAQLWNRQGGQVLSGSALLLQADMIDNQDSILASEGWLSLIAGQLFNSAQGRIAANQQLKVQAQQIDNHSQGRIYSQQADVELKAGTLSNHEGLIQARVDLALGVAGSVSNQGGQLLSEEGAVTLRAQSLDNRSGILASVLDRLKVAVQAVFSNQSGTVQGHRIELQADELANQQGHVAATADDLELSVATLNNQSGGLYAQQQLKLTGHKLDNSDGQIAAQGIDFGLSGALNNASGLIEADTLQLHGFRLNNRDGRLRALATTGHSRITSVAELDNHSGLIEIGNQDFTLDAPGLLNQSGQILHAGSGQFDLFGGQALPVGGSITSRGRVTLTSDHWENSARFEAGVLTLNVGRFTQTGSGQLIASQSLTATGDTWVNHGLIASDGDLSLNLSGSYSGNGQLVSLGDLELVASRLSLDAQGLVYGAGHTRLQGQQLINQGVISPAGSLQIEVQQLTNMGTLGSAGALGIQAADVLNEQGLIFSGADMQLNVGQLTNRYADIYSLGNIDLRGHGTSAQARRVDNISASMEALGDFSLRSALIENRRDVLKLEDRGIYYADITELPCNGPYNPRGDCTLGSNGKRNSVWQITHRERLEVVDSSAAAHIQAGANLAIYGDALLNSSSLISSGQHVSLYVKELINLGVKPADIETQSVHVAGRRPKYKYPSSEARAFNAKHKPVVQSSTVESDISRFIAKYSEREYLPGRKTIEAPLAGEEYSAIIQAAGTVTIEAQQQLENSVIRVSHRYVGGGNRVDVQQPGSTHGTDVQIHAQLPPDLQQKQLDPITLPDFSLPVGDKGLFRLSEQRVDDYSGSGGNGSIQPGQGASRAELQFLQGQSTGHNYLIETNPALTQMRQFLSSDYLLGGLGLSPDNMQKRLGDGLYEQKLIRDALVARTGQRFIAGIHSDEALFRYLMDNAIASKDALNLSVGIGLAADQVAALTHDIVWMETREVLGEQVLVPVLYMAQAEGRLAPNGALIQGQDLALISGDDLSNQGTLRASNSLAAQAQNIQNSGLMQAGERLSLLAEGSISNRQGGILAGRDVDLTARTGDILNERSITRHESALGNSRWETSFADSAARIEAANSLRLNAGREVQNLGGVLQSGGEMQISAGRDVQLSAVEDRHSTIHGSRYLNSQTTQLGSETLAGGNLLVEAGRNLSVVASRVESGQDLQLLAGNDLTLAAAANESHYYSKSKRHTSQRDQVQQQAGEVKSGGQFSAVAGNDLTLVSSNVTANNEAYLVAGGKLQLLAEQDVDYSFYEKKSKGSFGRKSFKSDEHTELTHVGSNITSGGDLTIISGAEQRYQAAQLVSGADLTLDSGAGIEFEGVKDLEQHSRIRSKSNWAWQSAKGKGHTDETLIQSQLQAQGEIAIRAAERIQIDIKEVNQHSINQTIDAMVQADPQLAWLKDMQQRGDVDWRQVKEVHDSFKYSNSGLSAPASMVIAIVVAYFTAGAGAGLTGATSTAGIASSNAVVSSVASNAVLSTLNNKGNLGAAFKEVTSSDALKGYAVSGVTAGLTAGVYDNWTGTQTGVSNTAAVSNNSGVLANSGKVAVDGGLSTWGGVGQFATNQALQNLTSTTLNKALGQGGSFDDALTTTLANTFAAAGFNWVGDFSQINQIENGSLSKIGLHAIMGGLVAEAAGGDFKSGALVAGANEALIDSLASQYDGMPLEQRSRLLTMNSQVLGVLVANMAGGDEQDLQTGAWVAGNATQYNWELHLPHGMTKYGEAASSLAKHMQEQGATPDELSAALQAMARGEGFSGPAPAEEFLKAWALSVLTGGGAVGTSSRGLALVVGGGMGGGSNVVYQVSTKELNDLSITDAVVATAVGALTQGKGLIGTTGISMGGAYIGSEIKGEDATAPVIGAGVGSIAGAGAVKGANQILPKSFPDKIKEIMGAIWGGFVSEAVSEGANGSVRGTGK